MVDISISGSDLGTLMAVEYLSFILCGTVDAYSLVSIETMVRDGRPPT